MVQEKGNVAWNLFTEVRKDILEHQKLQTQVIGFKITIVGTGIGLVLANKDTIPSATLLVPAFAAICFDFLIIRYSFHIRRTGSYCLKYIEPIIRESCGWPEAYPLWEEYMRRPTSRRGFTLPGNLGITVLAIAPAIYYMLILPFPTISYASWVSLFLLSIFFFFDIKAHSIARQFDKEEGG